jgi:antitoxin MazE
MRATVAKWGNSLALRLPRGIAGDADLTEGTVVDLAVEGGRIVVTPARAPVKLSDLLGRSWLHVSGTPMTIARLKAQADLVRVHVLRAARAEDLVRAVPENRQDDTQTDKQTHEHKRKCP